MVVETGIVCLFLIGRIVVPKDGGTGPCSHCTPLSLLQMILSMCDPLVLPSSHTSWSFLVLLSRVQNSLGGDLLTFRFGTYTPLPNDVGMYTLTKTGNCDRDGKG